MLSLCWVGFLIFDGDGLVERVGILDGEGSKLVDSIELQAMHRTKFEFKNLQNEKEGKKEKVNGCNLLVATVKLHHQHDGRKLLT